MVDNWFVQRHEIFFLLKQGTLLSGISLSQFLFKKIFIYKNILLLFKCSNNYLETFRLRNKIGFGRVLMMGFNIILTFKSLVFGEEFVKG